MFFKKKKKWDISYQRDVKLDMHFFFRLLRCQGDVENDACIGSFTSLAAGTEVVAHLANPFPIIYSYYKTIV